MTRSLRKGPFADEGLLRKVEEVSKSGQETITKIQPRHSTIFPAMTSLMIAVHDDREHVPVYITKDMIGHKPGESVATHAYRDHGADEKKVGSPK